MTFLAAIILASRQGPAQTVEDQLVGRWVCHLRSGPDMRGPLSLWKTNSGWRAEIMGRTAEAPRSGSDIRFTFPKNAGEFRGAITHDKIEGHWIQSGGNVTGFRMASPITFKKSGDRWVGEVVPLEDKITMYLVVNKSPDGVLKAYIRNPERNLGILLRADHLEVTGKEVKLIGGWAGSKTMQVLEAGQFDDENQVLHLYDANGAMSFDYVKADQDTFDDFFPRGTAPSTYKYSPPMQKSDGWKVAAPEEVGISRTGVEKFIQALTELPDTSVHDVQIHGVVLARHGKLVMEEYFHGYTADTTHDTRSAAKSVMSVLAGIAMRHDRTFTVNSSPFEIMGNTSDPAKNAIRVENLLTMSAGLDADDSNDDSKGREDTMTSQKEDKDWIHYTMNLSMAYTPGSKAAYASALPNFLGAVVAKKTGKWLPDYFRDELAKPLQVSRYYMPITPTGEAYMGGGMQWLPRDFLKLGQHAERRKVEWQAIVG